MFTVFASSGLGLTATKFISEYYNENSQEKSKASEIISLSNFISFTLGIIISLLVLLFSKSISDKIIGKPYLQIEIIIGAFMLLFNAINASQIGILSGFQKYKVIAVNSLVAVLLSFPIQIFGAYYFQIEGALLGFTVNFILLYLFNFFSIKKLKKQYGIQTKWRDYNKVMHVFYKFTIPSSLSSLMVTPITWFITVLLIRSQNGSYNLGVFEAANQIKMVIIFIPIALSNALEKIIQKSISAISHQSIL
jgi:O-antigen/teichoic acid export membrane protein